MRLSLFSWHKSPTFATAIYLGQVHLGQTTRIWIFLKPRTLLHESFCRPLETSESLPIWRSGSATEFKYCWLALFGLFTKGTWPTSLSVEWQIRMASPNGYRPYVLWTGINFISVQYFAFIERRLCKEELLKLFFAIILIIDDCGMYSYLCLIPRELSTWLLLIIREVMLGSCDFFFSFCRKL